MTSRRLVPIQEAVHLVDGLSLTLCSDLICFAQISNFHKLNRAKDKKSKSKDLVLSYANRGSDHASLTLEQYFYNVFSQKPDMKKKEVDAITGRRRTRVLITRGLNCRPTYPINFNYARGMLIMHKPWSVNSPLNFNDKQKTIDTFKQMLENRDVPTSVLNQYTREVVNHQQER